MIADPDANVLVLLLRAAEPGSNQTAAGFAHRRRVTLGEAGVGKDEVFGDKPGEFWFRNSFWFGRRQFIGAESDSVVVGDVIESAVLGTNQ